MSLSKKLYRSTVDAKISGVCGGIAEYFNMDATIIRLLWVLGSCVTGFMIGLVAYVACVFIIPKDPGCIDVEYKEKE